MSLFVIFMDARKMKITAILVDIGRSHPIRAVRPPSIEIARNG
jgi:hypothetical protein